MKLEEKQKVIEVLLCNTDWTGCFIDWETATFGKDIIRLANEEILAVIEDGTSYSDIEFDSCDAAYRLIESSPTLRREWFGVR